jgi:hypothetical protein
MLHDLPLPQLSIGSGVYQDTGPELGHHTTVWLVEVDDILIARGPFTCSPSRLSTQHARKPGATVPWCYVVSWIVARPRHRNMHSGDMQAV